MNFEVDLSTQLSTSNKDDLDADDVETFIDELTSMKKKIHKLLGKEVKKKDVKNLIVKLTSSLESLEISSEETLAQLKAEFESKCEETNDNQDALKQLLMNLSELVTTVNDKMGYLAIVDGA